VKISACALLTIAIVASGDGGAAPPYCKSDECREMEAIKASNLCGTGAGAAAAWVDDPFEPSIPGVAFYDSFTLQSLIERFGNSVKQTSWTEYYPAREPTAGSQYDRVDFNRYEFRGVNFETATLHNRVPHVTLIELSSPKISLKCGLRLGVPLDEFTKRLALPDPPLRTQATPRHCPVFYDLYGIPFDHGGGFMNGDNSTLCLYPDSEQRVQRLIWDKTRWASGYH